MEKVKNAEEATVLLEKATALHEEATVRANEAVMMFKKAKALSGESTEKWKEITEMEGGEALIKQEETAAEWEEVKAIYSKAVMNYDKMAVKCSKILSTKTLCFVHDSKSDKPQFLT